LQGFRFIPEKSEDKTEFKKVISASRNALKSEIARRKNLMLGAKDTQFTLKDDGQICYQSNPTNPLPGQPVAEIRKGESVLRPDIFLPESDLLEGKDRDEIFQFIKAWLHRHIDTVLEPLQNLDNEEGITPPARGICYQVKEALGIIPRHVVEPLIGELDPEGRAALRARKVKLGPVLVFIPALNKPAAVRLRGLLWSLWNDKPLPAPVPHDGAVSIVIERDKIDPRFYRAVGYPVYGPRAIRIDMLDRVINSIYDSAKDGLFKAKHEMAEWLGCPILDLYEVLEAMGHKKIEESKPEEEKPAWEKAEDKAEEKETEPVPSPETQSVSTSPEGEVKSEEEAKPKEEPKPEQKKPELATFRLKKGKASDRPKPPYKKQGKPKKPEGEKPEGKKFKGKKPFKKEDRQPRVMEAKAKTNPEDSPFAILQQLKDKK
jgi:ATP-dependent RNA helicase SUPV3L1/SUV3